MTRTTLYIITPIFEMQTNKIISIDFFLNILRNITEIDIIIHHYYITVATFIGSPEADN